MSERLQVLLDEAELRAIRRAARRQRLSVSEWVRRALRAARDREGGADAASKLEAVRLASAHTFPTADVDQMLEEIERGYAPES